MSDDDPSKGRVWASLHYSDRRPATGVKLTIDGRMVLTDAAGYFQIKLDRCSTVRVVSEGLDLDTTITVPDSYTTALESLL